MSQRLGASLVVLVFTLTTARAFAQTATATLSGTVHDPVGRGAVQCRRHGPQSATGAPQHPL